MFKRIVGAIRRVSFGKLSFACAFISCTLFTILLHIKRIGVLFGGNILKTLDRLGLVRQEGNHLAEIKPSSIFALNDANAVLWFTWIALVLAELSVLLALYADYKREPTLYASAGFVVATLGVGLLYPGIMVVAQAVGIIVLLSMRKRRVQTNQQ